MVVRGFQQPLVSGLYILAQLTLGLHLTHGAGSWLQSLGLARGWVRNLTLPLGYGIAGIIVIGNCSIPVSILLGWVK
jgi:succinate dehydrogenase / fumarate reductase cytochrome b subunit